MKSKTYIALDLKSFYASVECVERGLDPLTTNLVVADESRTEKTICLAVSPSLKVYGISGRARLFEVVQRVKEVNAARQRKAPGRTFSGASVSDIGLKSTPQLSVDYITAPPRMAHYIEYSTQIYNVYLKYIAPEDIHVYSIDEVFIDATHIKASANNKKYTNELVRIEAKHYQKELTEEINRDRAGHGKKPLKDDDDNDGEPPAKNIKQSTTDPECGLFHKGEHKVEFAYTAHTV